MMLFSTRRFHMKKHKMIFVVTKST